MKMVFSKKDARGEPSNASADVSVEADYK